MLKPFLIITLVLLAALCSAQTELYKSEQAVVLTSSNLPIVVIDTRGVTIPDDPKISASLKIYNRGNGTRNFLTDAPQFNGNCGIEVRGSSSQQFPKKSYGFETWSINGTSIDTSLLGMPSESDWILNANYTDKSFLRNVMAYQLWHDMGHYSTRYHFVELIVNNQYQGIYILSEKIKRDKNRLNSAKLSNTQNSGDELTGGYIFKVDKQTGSGGSGCPSPAPLARGPAPLARATPQCRKTAPKRSSTRRWSPRRARGYATAARGSFCWGSCWSASTAWD